MSARVVRAHSMGTAGGLFGDRESTSGLAELVIPILNFHIDNVSVVYADGLVGLASGISCHPNLIIRKG